MKTEDFSSLLLSLLLLTSLMVPLLSVSLLSQSVSASLGPSSGSATFNPTNDAEVVRGYPDTNYGTLYRVGIRSKNTSRYDIRGFLKFDISSLSPNTKIDKATLRLYQYYVGSYLAGVNDAEVREVDNDAWDENVITWNNQPGMGNLLGTIITAAPINVWRELDVTSYVQSEFNCGAGDTLISFGLKCVTENYDSSNRTAYFNSKEATSGENFPELVIEYHFEKKCMPDLGQHCPNWCWCAAAANSIYWWSQHGYPELIDDPADPTPYDDRYITDPLMQPASWWPWPCPNGGFYRLLHEIAIDCLYPWAPDNEVTTENTWCNPMLYNDMYFWGLQEFIDEQGAPLIVHEIVDNTVANSPPPQKDNRVIYRPPTLEDYQRELERCQDVLLVLYYQHENIDNYYRNEETDHVVTGVGFSYDNQWILVSDPWTPGAPDHGNDLYHENDPYENLDVLSEENEPLMVWYANQPVYVYKMIFISPEPIYLDNLKNLENPLGENLHELWPVYCRRHHVENWIDNNGDGFVSACDTIVLWNENIGVTDWYHVDNVTITLYVEGEYENLYLDLPPENFKDWDYIKINPVCTWWHEIWPLFCYQWHLVNWWDSEDGELSYCDNIELEDEWGYRENFHVEKVKYDIMVTKLPPPPIEENLGVDVEIDPEYQSGMPGENLYYTVWVTNTGNVQDTYDFENSDTKGWTLSLSQSSVGPLDPLTSASVTLTVTIPEDTPYCTTDNITVTATSQTDPEVSDSDNCIAHQDYYIKENMPDLGQHSNNWCWAAAAANSIKWWAEYRGYTELLDDPSDNVLDDNYLQIIPWAGCPSGGFLRLLHEIAIDCFGLPENAPPDATWCNPINNDNFFYGLQEFIDEQGAPLRVHEIVDNNYFGGENIPPEDGENVIYDQPTFENYKSELERCQDVLLQIPFSNTAYEYPYEDEQMDHIVTGVSFYDGGPGNRWIEVADPWTPVPWGPGPDHNNIENRYTYDNWPVVDNDPLTIIYTYWTPTGDNQIILPVVKMIYVSPAVVEENRGVVVDIYPKYQSGAPDNDIYYTVWITNTGTVSDTYDLENSDTNGWTLSLSQSSVGPIAPGDNDNVTLTVTLDNEAPFCTKVTVTATSQADNTVSDSDTCRAHAIPENALTVSLVAGWNLVGFTGVDNVNDTPNNMFCGLTYYTDYFIYYWTPPGGPYGLQGPDTVVEDNLGYWVWLNQDTTAVTSGTPPDNRDIYLENGWNLVSFPVVNENTTPNNVFTGLTYYTDYFIYYWTPPGGPYGLQGPDTVVEDNLGYWVWINRDNMVTVP